MKKYLENKIFAIFFIIFIDVLGLTIMLPLLPFYSERFGATPFVVGLLVTSYALAQFISGPILGDLSDRYGRRPILIISQIGTFIGFLLLAFSKSLTWIFVSRIIDGLTAGNITTAQAYIADHTSHHDRAKAMGKISIAFSVGFFIGPALTAFLFHYGIKVPILLAAALSLLSIFSSYFLLKENAEIFLQNRSKVKNNFFNIYLSSVKYLKDYKLRSLFIQIFFFYFSFSCYMSGFALFCERKLKYQGIFLNPRQIGWAFTYAGLLGILVQLFLIHKSIAKWGEKKLVIICFLLSMIGYFILSQIDNALFLILTGIFTSIGSGMLRPVLISEISKNARPEEKGRVIGLNQSLQSIAQIFAPMISTLVIERSHLSMWPILAVAFSTFGILFALKDYTKFKLPH